jgi:hypothetical protein
VWVIENVLVGGDEGHAAYAGGGDENAVGGIAVDGFWE